MHKSIVVTGALLIFTGIILGAFGAHGLKNIVNTDGLEIFDKGVKYQMYMGLGFLAVGLAADKFDFEIKWFFRLGLTGVLIFSILLYALTFKEHQPGLKILGAIVPVGGTLMIISWGILIFSLLKGKKTK